MIDLEIISEIELFFNNLPQNLAVAAWAVIRIAVLFVCANYLGRLISIIFNVVIKRRGKNLSVSKKRRYDTLCTLGHSVCRYGLYIVAVAISLDIMGAGRSVSTLIATAGIGGLALGFGAQSLVKDVVTGCFLLFENQYGVGDYVEIAGITGTVTAVAIRVTYLTGSRGETLIIPNGSVGIVTNYSRKDYTALVDVHISSDQDEERALAVLRDACERYAKDKGMEKAPTVLGVSAIEENRITIRIVCPAPAVEHFALEREIRLLMKRRLESEGIRLPYPRVTLERTE